MGRENEKVRATPRRDRLLVTDKGETKVRRRRRDASLPLRDLEKPASFKGSSFGLHNGSIPTPSPPHGTWHAALLQ